MIIYRTIDDKKSTKSATVYDYKTIEGKSVTDNEMLEYINKLVIPPAYRDVKIFYEKNGQPKILYQGYDTKKRLQRIYSEMWRKKATRKKFCELTHLANEIDRIAEEAKKEMSNPRLTKKKCIALIIRIVMICYFRIGNKRYQELYGSFGAMNIQKQHVKFKKDASGKEYVFISFTGKKGVLNCCNVYDKEVIKEIKELMSTLTNQDDFVFRYLDHGIAVPIKAIEINAWLKDFSPYITSKDFRTYDSNIFLIIYLRKLKAPTLLKKNMRKKNIVNAMKEISEKIHNTPAILKKNYTQSGIIDMYMNEASRFERYFINKLTPKEAFINYLNDYCKDYNIEKELKQ